MYFYIASGVLLIVSIFIFRYITYHMIVPKVWLLITVLLLITIAPSIYQITKSYIMPGSVKDTLTTREFKSNQDSEYSQLWLDYLSFRDGEIGRLGSEQIFREFLAIKGYTERTYALEVITDMLKEQGVDDKSIAEKCVKENISGSLE